MSCGAIYQCPNLSDVVFECPQQKLSFVGNSLYTSNKLLLYTNVNSSEYAIPDGSVEIAPSAFYGKSNLKVIHLNDGLKKLETKPLPKQAFRVYICLLQLRILESSAYLLL